VITTSGIKIPFSITWCSGKGGRNITRRKKLSKKRQNICDSRLRGLEGIIGNNSSCKYRL
jgi:hypothetical protein